MVCVFPSRCVEGNLRLPRFLCLASSHPMTTQTAQTDHVGGSLPAFPDRQARQSSAREWDRHVRYHHRSDHSVSVAGEQHPHTLDQHSGDFGPCLTVAVRGAPDAMRVARPVRRAGRGNGPGVILAPRPGPTPTSSDRTTVPPSAPSSSGRPATSSSCICPPTTRSSCTPRSSWCSGSYRHGCGGRSPGIRAPRWPSTSTSPPPLERGSTSAMPRALGSCDVAGHR